MEPIVKLALEFCDKDSYISQNFVTKTIIPTKISFACMNM